MTRRVSPDPVVEIARRLGMLERAVAAITRRLAGVPDTIQTVATHARFNGNNLAATTTYATLDSTTFTPPSNWDTYELTITGAVLFNKQNAGDGPRLRLSVGGVAGSAECAETSGGTGVTFVVSERFTGQSGAVTVATQIRKESGDGTVTALYSNLQMIARPT